MERDWDCVEYTPEDFEMVESWCREHGRAVVREEWLSSTGYILCNPKPVIAFWMYFDPSCDVGFVDWVITKPGTPLPVLKEGIIYSLHGPMRAEMKRRYAHTLITRSPMAMGRVMQRAGENGWHVYSKELMSMMHQYTEEELDEDQ